MLSFSRRSVLTVRSFFDEIVTRACRRAAVRIKMRRVRKLRRIRDKMNAAVDSDEGDGDNGTGGGGSSSANAASA